MQRRRSGSAGRVLGLVVTLLGVVVVSGCSSSADGSPPPLTKIQLLQAVAPTTGQMADHRFKVNVALAGRRYPALRRCLIDAVGEAEGDRFARAYDRASRYAASARELDFPNSGDLLRYGFGGPLPPLDPQTDKAATDPKVRVCRGMAERKVGTQLDSEYNGAAMLWQKVVNDVNSSRELTPDRRKFSACLRRAGVPKAAAVSETKFLEWSFDYWLRHQSTDVDGKRYAAVYVRCGTDLFVHREALLAGALPNFLSQQAPELDRLITDAEKASLV